MKKLVISVLMIAVVMSACKKNQPSLAGHWNIVSERWYIAETGQKTHDTTYIGEIGDYYEFKNDTVKSYLHGLDPLPEFFPYILVGDSLSFILTKAIRTPYHIDYLSQHSAQISYSSVGAFEVWDTVREQRTIVLAR